MRQFTHVDQDWFSIQPWPRLQAWLAAIVDAGLYTRMMQKYSKWKSGAAGVIFPPG